MMDNTDMPFTRDVLLWFLIYFYNSGQPYSTLRPAHFYLTGNFFLLTHLVCSEDPKKVWAREWDIWVQSGGAFYNIMCGYFFLKKQAEPKKRKQRRKQNCERGN